MLDCVSEKVYKDWLKHARIAAPKLGGFCQDCTQEYADKMRAKGKCAHPTLTFEKEVDTPLITKSGLKKGQELQIIGARTGTGYSILMKAMGPRRITACGRCGWESSFTPPVKYEHCPSCGWPQEGDS